jgi:hypothetical protein
MKMIRQRALSAFILIAALLAAGCLVLTKLGLYDPPGAFSHRIHNQEQDLDCKNCHDTAETSAKAGMPKLKQCMLCHEGIDEQKPPERKLSTLYGASSPWAQAPVLPEEVIFSHQIHVAGKQIACGECHKGIEGSQRVSDQVRVFKDDCMDCHQRSGKPDDCAVCHQEIRRDRKPASHAQNWKQFHGQAVRAGTGKSMDRCSLCHADSSCEACHQDEPPQNHTNHWRHRGHGIASSLDRTRGPACHRADFCERCHGEVSPRSHAGSWGSPRDLHCLTCHFPASGEQCSVCHRGAPSHELATPKPGWHSPAMNCRQCHGAGQALPHVDKGDNCNACHQ